MSALAGTTLLAVAACGAPAQTAPTTPKPPAQGVARFLPLPDATVYSYDTTSEPSGEHGLLVLEVRRPRPDLAELVVAGRARRLTVNEHDVAHVGGGYLLREPLVAGATWKGDFGTVKVTAVDKSVTVPAGTFSGCLETLEEAVSNEGEKRTTTVFCPGVGIAERQTEAEQEGQQASERIALRSFGPRFDASSR